MGKSQKNKDITVVDEQLENSEEKPVVDEQLENSEEKPVDELLTDQTSDEETQEETEETQEETEEVQEKEELQDVQEENAQNIEDIVQNKEVQEISNIELLVEIPFTDKYDKTKHYKIGDTLNVDSKRAKELLADKRNLVSEKK